MTMSFKKINNHCNMFFIKKINLSQDYMRDIEGHTDDYLALCPEAKELSDKYKPSDVLDEMMSSLHDRWSAYVGELQNRYSTHTHTHTHTYVCSHLQAHIH